MPDASEVINALTAPDAYTTASTIQDTPIRRVLVDVVNQGIYWQLKRASTGGNTGMWEDVEVFMAPGSRVLARPGIVGIRFRAAVKAVNIPAGGLQAVVTIEAVK